MTARIRGEALELYTDPHRLETARRAHLLANRRMFILFHLLAVGAVLAGIPLVLYAGISPIGVTGFVIAFFLFPFLAYVLNKKSLKRAETYISSDGETQILVDTDRLVIADTDVPYERITFVYATVEGEEYSDGGVSAASLSYRLGIEGEEKRAAQTIGSSVVTRQQSRLYREGAMSVISVAIGVDEASRISDRSKVLRRVAAAQASSIDAARIDMPFGAFLSVSDLEEMLGALHERAGTDAFPAGIVSGAEDWRAALASAAMPRTEIWKESERFFA